MRVIAGERKGHRLKAVPGKNTRPTTDKVKESVFNMIGPHFDEGLGLDLFAGSGGLGIEGLSRGLEKVFFVDQDKKAIETIRENLSICRFEDKSEVYRNDWKRALKAIIARGQRFKVIWLDPPYKKQVYISILEEISEHQMLEKTGCIVCEHAVEVQLPDVVGSMKRMKYVEYGMIAISIYQESEENE
jgi:16S rRNA (guanine966-N2)-methyltransferase